jgi:hypothetical protein
MHRGVSWDEQNVIERETLVWPDAHALKLLEKHADPPRHEGGAGPFGFAYSYHERR